MTGVLRAWIGVAALDANGPLLRATGTGPT